MRALLCFFILACFSIAAKATVVYFDSDAGTANNSGDSTVELSGALNPNPAWAAPLAGSEWISYGATGASSDPGYFSPVDGTVVTFTTQFTLSGIVTAANLTVLADDSTSVVLNGHTLISAGSTPACLNPAGCVSWTTTVLTLGDLGPYLADGVNTLAFGVVQLNGGSFGLDFAGSVDPSDTSELTTLYMISGGLAALLYLRRRK